jgi:glycosyltransferase involved in cell wall biosynthesis
MNPRIMFIVPTNYDSLMDKGVTHLIQERDENGFFNRVITIHPITEETRIINLNEIHSVVEIGINPIAKKNRFLRYLIYPAHLIKIKNITCGIIKDEKINIIRATDPYWMGFIGLILSRLTHLPVCVSIHSDYDKRYELDGKIGAPTILGSRKLAKKLERFVLSHSDMVMPIRKSLGEKAILNGLDPKKIRIIPHGIDMSPFSEKINFNIYSLLGLDRNKKIISFIGRLSNDNYIDDVLLLIKQLARERNDFLIVMAGGGNEEKRIRQQVENEPVLKQNLVLVGFQSREICLDLRRISTINLCLMAGFSLIEACAAGRPVIAYDIEWHSELVINNTTGYLIEEHNIEQLVQSINMLLDNPAQANKMGESARELAFQRHDIYITSETKKRHYVELLARGKAEIDIES